MHLFAAVGCSRGCQTIQRHDIPLPNFLVIEMLNLLADSLVIVGGCVLMGALMPVGKLIAQLPSEQLRRRWYALRALIVLFIIGYISYLVVFWNRHTIWLDLIVPSVFFFGAGFVWLTSSLSLQTAIDVRRMTQLEHESITDPLIGIYNRRYLDRLLDEEVSRAQRYALPLSVLLLDIDHFKHVNDRYGHQVGDLVLIYLGKLVTNAIRASDVAARYGGEELLIIATNTTMSSAAELAERLRRQVENDKMVLSSEPKNQQEICVTVSIGVAGLSQEITDSQSLIRKADEALYHAKQAGRNRVSVSDVNIPNLTPPAM
jgi:diguanylate cyclase (GGDEF)-like protein